MAIEAALDGAEGEFAATSCIEPDAASPEEGEEPRIARLAPRGRKVLAARLDLSAGAEARAAERIGARRTGRLRRCLR